MAFPTTAILDSFTRANETPLAGNWSNLGGTNGGWNLVSNAAKIAAGSATEYGSYWNPGTFGADAEVYYTISALPTNVNSSIGLELRLNTPGGSRNGYHLDWFNGTMQYLKLTGGAYSQIGTDETVSLAVGDKLGFEIKGSKLQAYKYTGGAWSAVGSGQTDTTYSAAGYIAIHGYVGQPNETSVLDDVGGGTIIAAALPILQPKISNAVYRM